MKTYLARIKKKTTKGKVWYQPQVKPKNILSFFYSWGPLTMLIFNRDDVNVVNLTMWSDAEIDAKETLDRFEFLNQDKLKLEFKQ